MAKFHINPNTGNPGKCSAAQGNCPFGSDAPHFSTENDARQAFEMVQGGSFGIAPPLLTTNKRELTEIYKNQFEDQALGYINYIPDRQGVFKAAASKLQDISQIGFSDKAAREESSLRLNQLAEDLYKTRTDESWDKAMAARFAYEELVRALEDRGLKDMRNDEERASDDAINAYEMSPSSRESIAEASDKELEKVLDIAKNVKLEDLSDEQANLLIKHGDTPYVVSVDKRAVANAKKIKAMKTALERWDELPDYARTALGTKAEVKETIDKIEIFNGSINASVENVVKYSERELSRRKINKAVIEKLKKEAN